MSGATTIRFRSILVASRTDVFTRHLITQPLSYAAGRHMEPVDEAVIEEIFEVAKKDNFGLRTLAVECLASEISGRSEAAVTCTT